MERLERQRARQALKGKRMKRTVSFLLCFALLCATLCCGASAYVSDDAWQRYYAAYTEDGSAIYLAPGKDETERNFSWYAPAGSENCRVRISDRATLMNLLLSTDCYTIGTGIMTSELNQGSVVAVPLDSPDIYSLVLIYRSDLGITEDAEKFIEVLEEVTGKGVE